MAQANDAGDRAPRRPNAADTLATGGPPTIPAAVAPVAGSGVAGALIVPAAAVASVAGPSVAGAIVVPAAAVAPAAGPVVAGALVVPVAVAPVARPDVAGAIVVPLGRALARFDIEAVLLGPLPTQTNPSCKIHAKLIDETWP